MIILQLMFYEKLSTYYDQLFPLREMRLSFILSNLAEHNNNILDIGCATGHLAIALSKKGHSLTAIDLDGDMIRQAEQHAKDTNQKILFKAENMLNIEQNFKPERFDTVLCFGNTLVHLNNPEEITDFFKSVNNILKKNGTFILQIVNYDRILNNNITELPDLKKKGLYFERKYKKIVGSKNLEFIGTLTIEKNNVISNTEILYPLNSNELKRSLIEAGFDRFQLYGDEKHSKFTKESPALIAIIKK